MSKGYRLWLNLFIVSGLIFSGCAAHQIGYEVKKECQEPICKSILALTQFSDVRPQEEHSGQGNEFLAFSSTDKSFTKPVDGAVTEKLKEDLTAGGIKVVLDGEVVDAGYQLSGQILHFQTVTKLPKTTVVPYLGTVSSLWTSDEFITAVTIQAKLVRVRDNQVIFDKPFTISEDLKLKTGPLNLGRYGRGLDYKLKLLDTALENVLGQIKNDVIIILKEE